MKTVYIKNRILISILYLIFNIVLDAGGTSYSQSKNPDEIIKKVKEEFNKIKDYEVDVHIKIDVEFLKAPETEAKSFFKQPDKIHIESQKFAMLPREGLNFSPIGLLNEKYTALYEREDTIGNILTSVVKIIPIGNDNDIILTTLWIDQSRNVIRKVESSKKPTGTFTIEFNYEKYDDTYYLPSLTVFSFTVDRTRFLKGMDGQLESGDKDNLKKSRTLTGKVFLSYKNYKINQNLPDELFKEKESKPQ